MSSPSPGVCKPSCQVPSPPGSHTLAFTRARAWARKPGGDWRAGAYLTRLLKRANREVKIGNKNKIAPAPVVCVGNRASRARPLPHEECLPSAPAPSALDPRPRAQGRKRRREDPESRLGSQLCHAPAVGQGRAAEPSVPRRQGGCGPTSGHEVGSADRPPIPTAGRPTWAGRTALCQTPQDPHTQPLSPRWARGSAEHQRGRPSLALSSPQLGPQLPRPHSQSKAFLPIFPVGPFPGWHRACSHYSVHDWPGLLSGYRTLRKRAT